MAARTTISWRFFLATTFALLVILGMIHAWHGRKVRTQTSAYLRQADLAAQGKDHRREIIYLERYLRSEPQSNDVRERLARLMAKNAATRKQVDEAYFLLEDCLRRMPENDDLRRFTVEFAMDPRTALILEVPEHLKVLQKKYPNDADLVERLATYHTAKLEYKEAILQFQAAYILQPDRLTAFAGHALIERERNNNPQKADDVILSMVEQNKQSFRAHLYAYEYYRKYRINDRMKPAMDAARALAKDELDVILAYADWCREEAQSLHTKDARAAAARRDEARRELDRGLALARANRSGMPPQATSFLLMHAAIVAESDSPHAAAKFLTATASEFPDHVSVLSALVDYQIQAGEIVDAQQTLEKLETLGAPKFRLAYDRARLSMASQDWLKASREFQKLLDEQPSDQALVRSISYQLGQCYEQIGQSEQRLAAMGRAIPTDINDPLWVSAHLGEASAYADLGRADDALKTYSKVALREKQAWLAVARLSILQALRSADTSLLKWNAASDAVDQCRKELPGSTDAQLVDAELKFFQNREREAQAIIDQLFKTRRQEPAVWVAMAFSQARTASHVEGIALLEQGRKEVGDPVDLRLALAQLLVQDDAAKPESKLLLLADDLEKYKHADRRRLLIGLAERTTQAGFDELGGRFWEQAARAFPDNLQVRLALFDRAFRLKDDDGMARMRADFARIDGPTGVSTRLADAFIQIAAQRENNDRTAMTATMQLLDRLERDRPAWSRIAVGKALVFERLGNSTSALASYRKAVTLGESQPDVYRRLISLLAERGQYAEANSVLVRLPNSELNSRDAMRLAADVSLRSNNPTRAIELAAKLVPDDSTNHSDVLWKGRLLWSAKNHEGALAAFRKAALLNPGDPVAWLLQIETLMADKKADEAQAVYLDAKGKVRAEVSLLFTAQSLDLLSQIEEARAAYAAASRQQKDNAAVLRAEADFLMKQNFMAEAGSVWKRVIDLGTSTREDKEFARNMLAICLAMDPDYKTARSAVITLGLDRVTSDETPISKRTNAIVRSLMPDRTNKLSAIRLFEEMQSELSDNDRFLLAQWYFQVDNESAGQQTMSRLLSRPPSDRNPHFLSFYAGWWLAKRQAREAEQWVNRLEAIEPNAIRTIEHKVQMLSLQRKPDDARAILKEQAARPNAKLNFLAIIAEGAELYPEAESLYQRYVETSRGKTPDVELSLAGFYARRGRLTEALNACEKAWATSSPDKVGQLCIEALSVSPDADRATKQRVATMLETARANNPAKAANFNQQLAFVRSLLGEYEEAIRIYESLLNGPATNSTILNNLAFLLSAHRQKHDDALRLIARAKDIAGPLPDLLDTEAIILTARGRPEDLTTARKLLVEALDVAPSASISFHLAQLEERAGNRNASQAAWRDAREKKLKSNDLHPLEKSAFEAMVKLHK